MRFINTPSEPYTSYKVILSGVQYEFTQRWNTRTQSWYLTVTTPTGIDVVKNRKLLPNVWLKLDNIPEMPYGNLMILRRNTSVDEYITKDNFGIDLDFTLAYYTKEDL